MKSRVNISEDLILFKAVKSGSTRSFALLFDKYYRDLVLYCGTFLQDLPVCEDIVQNIFLKLWETRSDTEINTSFKGYLVRCARNMCMDELRHRKVKSEYLNSEVSLLCNDGDDHADNYILYSELYSSLAEAVRNLPEKEKEAFEMSRIDDLKYRQIAEILGVSQRTVEVRISKALKILKKTLSGIEEDGL